MINWKTYDHDNPPKDGGYLVSDGEGVEVASVQSFDFGGEDLDTELFLPERTNINGSQSITHYAEINLPEKE